MKLISIIFAILFFTITSFSQEEIQKGTYNVAGSLSFSSSSQDYSDGKQTELSITPQIGYFFINNFALGINLQYQKNDTDAYSITTWGIGPMTRFYIGKNIIHPFIELSFLYGETMPDETDAMIISRKIGVVFGLDYFITNSVALESALSYTFDSMLLTGVYRSYYSDDEIMKRTIKFAIGLNIFL
ncbi:MAG: hypothetical protein IPM56_08205 [Ignavibacteriales bacterium]|nr:MAG: hypothetical protein IPM56_08205 [Ignavibacteriales bacterium]